MQHKRIEIRLIALIFILGFFQSLSAQTNVFTYQGSLNNGGPPANGSYDFEFALFDSFNGGNQVGTTLSRNSVAVTNGIFAVQLDFGVPSFPGAGRYLEIRVRPAGQPGITILTPRQLINSAPYSMKTLNADTAATATNATQLGGIAANQFVVTTDPRMSDARTPTAGSGDYVQNRGTPQAATNFNISGNGTVGGTFSGNIVNATTQFNLGNVRVLSTAGSSNLFVGDNAGAVNTGTGNTFVGSGAGDSNTTGFSNTFVGSAGGFNTTGRENSFFGYGAGSLNTIGNYNSFFGRSAGYYNSGGDANSFFGYAAGNNNTTGNANSFFGYRAAYENTTGYSNSIFGYDAGNGITTGFTNSFFGARAGFANSVGFQNAFFGSGAGESNTDGNNNSFFATRAGDANTTADFNSFFGTFGGFANTTGFSNAFFGESAGEANTTGSNNTFFGRNAGVVTTTGGQNTFLGFAAGDETTTGHHNTFVGYGAGNDNTTGDFNTTLGSTADISGNLSYATAIGAGAVVSASNTIVLGRAEDRTIISGYLRLTTFAAGGTDVCFDFAGQVGFCSSSLRYKTSVESYGGGLDIVRRLRPITFRWKDGGVEDVGFGAEEVADVESRLVLRNKDGRIEGVKYRQITTVLVNAVKEQQAQIEAQKNQIDAQGKVIDELQQQVEGLKKIFCATNQTAEICKEMR